MPTGPNGLRHQHEGRAEAIVDPALAVSTIAHARAAVHRLRLELGAAAEIGDQAEIVELRAPAPFEIAH